jgi:hypothetical protein
MRREPLPAALSAAPFTVAGARSARVRPKRLRGLDLARTTQSVRAPVPLTTLHERASAFALALPADSAFSHVTAAQLWGLTLPPRLARQTRLDVIRASGRGRVARHGCCGHRGLEIRQVDVLQGVRVVALPDLWCDLGAFVGRGLDVDDLVVIGDEVVRRLDGLAPAGSVVSTGRTALLTALSRRGHHRGKRSLDEAARLVRPGVRSPMETRARLMFHRAGFPEPLVNHPVHTAPGEWLLEGDLVWRDQRVIGEYQGAVHAPIARRSSDAHRRGLAEDAGWRMLEIFAEDVFGPARRVTCLTRFARILGLDVATLQIA